MEFHLPDDVKNQINVCEKIFDCPKTADHERLRAAIKLAQEGPEDYKERARLYYQNYPTSSAARLSEKIIVLKNLAAKIPEDGKAQFIALYKSALSSNESEQWRGKLEGPYWSKDEWKEETARLYWSIAPPEEKPEIVAEFQNIMRGDCKSAREKAANFLAERSVLQDKGASSADLGLIKETLKSSLYRYCKATTPRLLAKLDLEGSKEVLLRHYREKVPNIGSWFDEEAVRFVMNHALQDNKAMLESYCERHLTANSCASIGCLLNIDTEHYTDDIRKIVLDELGEEGARISPSTENYLGMCELVVKYELKEFYPRVKEIAEKAKKEMCEECNFFSRWFTPLRLAHCLLAMGEITKEEMIKICSRVVAQESLSEKMNLDPFFYAVKKLKELDDENGAYLQTAKNKLEALIASDPRSMVFMNDPEEFTRAEMLLAEISS